MPEFAVLDALGECYAIAETRTRAEFFIAVAEDYLDEALASGHPRAPEWVGGREPFRIEEVSEERVREIREEMTPVLEREP